MNPTRKRWLAAIISAGIAIATVCYTGYVKSYVDHEVQTTFFVKRYPTLQMEFYDPFANEGDDSPVDQLSSADRLRFSDYCKYRFGIVDFKTQALEACKARVPGYL